MCAPSILLVDDEPSVLRYTRTCLETDSYHVETAASGEEALRKLQRGSAPNLILLDVVMPGMDGLKTLENCKKICPDQKVLMMSGCHDTSKVVQAIKLGAIDYLDKPLEAVQLKGAIRRVLESNGDDRRCEHSNNESAVIENLEDDLFFFAASPVMKQIHAQVALIARADVSVLLLGESGVGKEILARLIHKMSHRANRPLVRVNCAALPAELLESELFGYEAGAFTGAKSSKPGKFELAHSGTILLDEIGEMSVSLQAKLLHVLQDGRFARLGSRTSTRVDSRVVAATNIDIEKAIADHKLRQDLYYRLNAFTITIPPLRERRQEIPLLLTRYMHSQAIKFGKRPLPVSDRLVRECLRYHWPGNLRELGNFTTRYLVLEDESLLVEELQSKVKGIDSEVATKRPSTPPTKKGLKAFVRSLKDDVEAKEIQSALEAAVWNRKSAAVQLGISYKALLYKIRQYGISVPVKPQSKRALADNVTGRIRKVGNEGC